MSDQETQTDDHAGADKTLASETRLPFATRVRKGFAREASKTAKAGGRLLVISMLMSTVGVVGLQAMMPKAKKVEDGSTFYVSLDRPLTEWSKSDDMPSWAFFIGAKTQSANAVSDAIAEAAADERIERLILDLDGMGGSPLGAARKVRDAVAAFQASGKPVTVYASSYDNAAYLIASAAEERLMHPMGGFEVGRFEIGTLYYGDAFERWGVTVATGKAGRYKSAVEPYLRSSMSDDSRAAAEAFLADRAEGYAELVSHDGAEWGIGGSDADKAVERGYIQRTVEAPDLMSFAFGEPLGDERPFTTLQGYYADKRKPDLCADAMETAGAEGDDARRRLAVITLEGAIVRGASDNGKVGAVTVTEQIEKATRDEHVAGMIVRISSPGGDAVASEMIRSGLEAFRRTGRPVLVSMGSVAASGGYWIATAADEIHLEPTTLTGSIGVFSLRPSASPALAELGLRYDGVSIGEPGRFGGIAEPISDSEERWMQASVERVYDQFTGLVADARGLDVASAPDWAEGRVWGARQAIDLGLADELSSYSETLTQLSDRTGVPAACTVYVKSQSRAGNILAQLLTTVAPMEPPVTIPKELEALARMTGPEAGQVQAFCPTCGTD